MGLRRVNFTISSGCKRAEMRALGGTAREPTARHLPAVHAIVAGVLPPGSWCSPPAGRFWSAGLRALQPRRLVALTLVTAPASTAPVPRALAGPPRTP